jgi:phosphomannomutase
MANPLRCIVSVSGIRGIIGENLDVDQLMALAAAHAAANAKGLPVVLGRDSRPTGHMVAQAVAAGLRAAGCAVIDIGLVPTPTVPIVIADLAARGVAVGGGIQVSASHNNVEWNALKFFNATGRNVDQAQLDALLAAYAAAPVWKRWDGCGAYSVRTDALDLHLARVLAAVDVELIRAARLPVVVDCVNGAGAELAPRLLQALGCRVTPVHARSDLLFPREPEPTAANVTETGAIVRAAGAAIGFVQDPDADRLAMIDGEGVYVGEEYTLALCAAARFAAAEAAGQRGAVAVTNLSTSRMIDDVAARHGGRVVRAKVGEANVVDGMQANQAMIGGEGNGGVIEPRVVWGRDSHIGMALVLEYLARQRQTLAQVIAGMPRYAMLKTKIGLDRAQVAAAIPRIQAAAYAQGATVDGRDGLKLSWPDRWVHLRASGTEPVSRIIAEAPDQAAAEALVAGLRLAAGI